MSGTSGPTVKRLIQTSLSFTVPPKKVGCDYEHNGKQNVL